MLAQEMQKKPMETKMAELKRLLIQDNNRELWKEIEDSYIQELLGILIKMYVVKVRAGEEVAPLLEDGLTGTETLVFADQLLSQMDLELFEVQMWRSLGSNY